ncbi:MAG TPA: RraA family protein [Sphingomonadales bacterium]|nr:RraA family protein [Sphingomonadales bacterium]
MKTLPDFRGFSLAALSDALDLLGIPGQCHGIKPVAPPERVVGPCFTVEYGPIEANPRGTVGDYIDEVPPGHVVLIANQGRTDCTVWGDILTLAAKKRGIAGVVIDGVCRDSDGARTQRFPLFSKGTYMRTGKNRVALTAVQKTICVSGVKVSPGDVVVGSTDGVVFVPAALQQKVAALAHDIEATESQIRAFVESGGSLKAARE